jgi:hypothetical protein
LFVENTQTHVKDAQNHVKTTQKHVKFLHNFKNKKAAISKHSLIQAQPKPNPSPIQNGKAQN